MEHFIASVFLSADRAFEQVAAELNSRLFDGKLAPTDRFDEVPGYVAEIGTVFVELQGIPAEIEVQKNADEPAYYLSIQFSSSKRVDLVRWLGDIDPMSLPVHHGYRDFSQHFAQQVQSVTSIACTVES